MAVFRWWLPSLAAGAVSTGLLVYAVSSESGAGWFEPHTAAWCVLTALLHLPFLVTLFFIVGGLVERLGFFWRGRLPEAAGPLPSMYPTVCVQLPMYNEHTVAQRVIEAASAMTWPADRFSVQVLDDSTDEDTRALVEAVCSRVRASTGVNCYVLHRANREGYKAGALEDGRNNTDAEFLAIFDSDFVPPADYLVRMIPHFYLSSGEPDFGLALVQAQWGHLNHDESWLTRAQSLWVDDHHTLQMSWRSAVWQFVNFTGTAGVWRAAAIRAAGGWRAASLVEDCELSFRHLFAGYRTKFVKEIVVPAELPPTYTAYKAQQRRWTQGWAQLQRMHLATLLLRYRCSWLRRVHLIYHMCISWQWPAWALWITMLPFLIFTGHWFGSFGLAVGACVYVMPTALFAVVSATVASLETKYTYDRGITATIFLHRFARIVPYLVVSTGMLAHQFSSFAEGLFGPLHSVFERTPKAASVTTASSTVGERGSAITAVEVPNQERASAGLPCPAGTAAASVAPPARASKKSDTVKVQWPYVVTEAFFAVNQLGWAAIFAANGLVWCGVGAVYVAACVIYLGFFYGDQFGKRCFILDGTRHNTRAPANGPRLPAAASGS